MEKLYAALGGEPVKIPFNKAVYSYDFLYSSRTPDIDSFHQPKYLVVPPSVSNLWALCAAPEPSIRLTDLSDSFRIPFHPDSDPFAVAPWEFAAPELLLKLPGEVT